MRTSSFSPALGALLIWLGVAFPLTAAAAVRLPALFSDHMVLQGGVPAPVWGWASPGEKVSVTFEGQTRTTTTGADRRWQIALDPLSPGGPFTMMVKGHNTLTVRDVLVGEVWIGSGQSNMGFPFKMPFYPYLKVKDYEQEKATAREPEIRMFLILGGGRPSDAPQADCRGRWFVTTPENVDHFSAELYFFGRELHHTLGVPVGLIKSAVGGTEIRLWIDAAAQRADPDLKLMLTEVAEEKAAKAAELNAAEAKYRNDLAKWESDAKAAKAAGNNPPRRPGDPAILFSRHYTLGGLYNSMIAPLVPYAIRGVVWHQGENDAGHRAQASYYRYELPLLIKSWRARWGYDFPFAWVQLANLDNRTGNWPIVREAMRKTLVLPKTGMAVAIDLGEAHNIHPRNKQAVGHRLALWALGDVYGKGNETSGPLYAGFSRQGSDAVVAFTHTRGGLVAKDGPLQGFALAGADGQWHGAYARIDGDRVVVSSPMVEAPVAVRYAWASNPVCNLYNGAGLPASPFSTND